MTTRSRYVRRRTIATVGAVAALVVSLVCFLAVQSVSAGGERTWNPDDASLYGSTDILPPGPPLAVTARLQGREVRVSWDPPSSSGSFMITNYRVESEPARATCLSVNQTCVVTNLIYGVAYRFRVSALSGAGWGAWSEWSETVSMLPAEQSPSSSATPEPPPSATSEPSPSASPTTTPPEPDLDGDEEWADTIAATSISPGSWRVEVTTSEPGTLFRIIGNRSGSKTRLSWRGLTTNESGEFAFRTSRDLRGYRLRLIVGTETVAVYSVPR